MSPENSPHTSPDPENVLIAVAWPYANGERHIGHASSLVPADVEARYQRAIGNRVLMVGGTDEHGTPNMLAADEQGITPQEYVDGTSKLIRRDFIDLGMSYDWFTRTTSPVHKENAKAFFEVLADKGLIFKRSMLASYDAVTDDALPDRLVEGLCPNCGAHCRGDQCDDCRNMLETENLVNPTSTRTGNAVVFREAQHYFLDLESLSGRVADFLSGGVKLRDDARKFSESLVTELKARSITREMDWGIELPERYDLPEEQRVMYVWFEAVLGYITAAMERSAEDDEIDETSDNGETEETGESYKKWWQNDDARHYYFMGKDNVPFHTQVLPAIIEGLNDGTNSNWHLPDVIASTGNLNFKDGKFSSSRGNVIYIHDLVESIGPDAVRFYCIASGPETKDTVFSYENLAQQVNTELLAKWGNLISRSIKLIKTNNDGEVPPLPKNLDEESRQLLDGISDGFDDVGSSIANTEFSKALSKAMALVTKVNQYINARKPWKQYKEGDADAGNDTMAVVATAIANINTLLAPFIPHASQHTYELFGGNKEFVSQPGESRSQKHGVEVLTGDYTTQEMTWQYNEKPTFGRLSDEEAHLFKKIDPEKLEEEIRAKLVRRGIGERATKVVELGL